MSMTVRNYPFAPLTFDFVMVLILIVAIATLVATTTLHVRGKQRWFSLLMMSMLLHLSDVFLLKFDMISAEEVQNVQLIFNEVAADITF